MQARPSSPNLPSPTACIAQRAIKAPPGEWTNNGIKARVFRILMNEKLMFFLLGLQFSIWIAIHLHKIFHENLLLSVDAPLN